MKKITSFHNFNINKVLTGLLLLLLPAALHSQVFWTELFNTGCTQGCNVGTTPGGIATLNGNWTVTDLGPATACGNPVKSNAWFISCEENGHTNNGCSTGPGCLPMSLTATVATLHVGNVAGSPTAIAFCSTGDCGALYDPGNNCAGGVSVVTNKRAESPTINCTGRTNITVDFNYIEQGDVLVSDFCTVEYSADNGVTWNTLVIPPVPGVCPSTKPKWRALSSILGTATTLPASCDNNPTVKIGFRWVNNNDGASQVPSFAVDNLTLAVPANTITTGTVTGSPFCACTTFNLPFTSVGTYNAGNIYTAQLSDATGSFAVPTTIGTLASTANAGTISCTIPCNTPTGSGYLIQVVSSSPVITGSNNGVAFTVTQPSVATFSYTGSPYCQNGINPSPTFSGGGVAGTFTASSANLLFSDTNPSSPTGDIDLSGSTSGSYTVTNTIAASGGCPQVTATSGITINPIQSAAFNYSSSTYCQSATNPTPTITGTPGGTFSASPAGLSISSTTGTINLGASTAGVTFTITYTTPGPCGSSSTASVTITAASSATFSYTGSPYCPNSPNPSPVFVFPATAGVFTASPGGLNINSSTGVITIAGSTPNSYTITNTIAASGVCPAVSATFNITINPTQDPSFSYAAPSFCQSGTTAATITGTPGGSFTANPNTLPINAATGSINLAGSPTGNFTITYTTPGPCASSSSASITITGNPVATFSYTGSPYCPNSPNPSPVFVLPATAGVFSASPGGLNINSSTGVITIAGSTTTSYTITNTIAASGGCPAASATANITINPTQDSSFNYSSNIYCQSAPNPTPTITGTAGGTFTSTPPGLAFVSTSTGQINLSGSTGNTTYNITYHTPGPCATSSTVSVTITSQPVATFSYTGSPYCQNGINPSPTFSGGGVAGIFSATPIGLVFVSTATGQVNLAASTPGTYTVTDSIPANGGCGFVTSTSSITIQAAAVASFSYTGTPYCQTATNPTPTYSPGGVAGTFTANPTTGLSIVAATGAVNLAGSTAGTYIVTNTIPPQGACPAVTATASIEIDAPAVATFSYTGTPYCQNVANPSPTLPPGSTAGNFSATPVGLQFVSTSTGVVNLTSSNPGVYTVTNSIPATANCAAVTATSTITILLAPNVTVNSPSGCTAHADTLIAAGATTYTWSPGTTPITANTVSVNPATTTTFTVVGTSGSCSDTAISTVTVNNCTVPVAHFNASDTLFCNNGCVVFSDASTGFPTVWSWQFPGGTPSSANVQGPVFICYNTTGTFPVTLVVSNPYGADTIVKVAYIHVVKPIPVHITGNLEVNACETTDLTAQPNGLSYAWGPNVALSCTNCQTVTVAPTDPQQYYVSYVDVNGCIASDTALVNITKLFSYFMPTGFSPNGDGVNDQLLVHGRGIDYISLKIFDRLGEKVFETSDINTGWDGTYKSIPLNNNVFVYELIVTYCDKSTAKENGNVTLVR